jgi:hypothetical protein
MSRILRRPMFRGGRVDSRGTGITANLGYQAGGRVGYRDAGFVTGAELLAAANTFPELNMYKSMKLNPKSKFIIGQGNTINGFDVDKVASFLGGEGDLAFASTDNFSYPMGVDTTKLGETTKKPETLIASKDTDELKIGETNEADIMDDTTITGETTEKFKSPTMEMKEKEFSGEIDSTPSATVLETEDPLDDPKIEDPDTIIKDQADKYFELMGGGKAFSRDAGDMLLRFAGAEGANTAEKLQNYFKAEAKAGPSRTEKIKSDAAKVAINYETQKEFLEKKLDNAKDIAEKQIIAQKLRDLNKSYAPGITEKNVNFLTNQKKGTAKHTAALKQSGFGFNIFQEAKKAANNFETGKLTPSDINSLGPIYYDDWGGIFQQGKTEKDGTYLIIETSEIVKIKNGKEAGRQTIDVQ